MNDKNSREMRHIVAWALLLVLVAAVAWLKYPRTEFNYLNSDATWHVVLTMNAYDETPVSIHKFLPILSLGDERDKFIPWGTTICDTYGNYYYTSFSSMGFILPYLVLKFLHLGLTPQSLFLFNTGLLWLSCGIIYELISLWSGPRLRYDLLALMLFAYVLTPEIMQSMGLTYWHQSLMQVFLPLQLLLYYRWITSGKGFWWFVVFCLLCPYTEWSGYVANAGYFLVEGYSWLKNRNGQKKKSMIAIAVSTLIAGIIFCVQYIPVTGMENFVAAIEKRFLARSASRGNIISLLNGYWSSCKALILLVAVCLIIWIVLRLTGKSRGEPYTSEQKLVVFLTVFPLIENLIMEQHATAYTFDRMKLVLPLLLLLYGLLYSITSGHCVRAKIASIMAALVVCFFAREYWNSGYYIWPIDYQKGNTELCDYIKHNFDDSILGCTNGVRGYVNMMVGRGCYEWVSNIQTLEDMTEKTRYIVLLSCQNVGGMDAGGCYCMDALVLDRTTGQQCTITNLHSGIEVSPWQ